MLAPHAIQTIGPVDARVKVTAVVVVGEEGVQLGQQAHRREPIVTLPASASGLLELDRWWRRPAVFCGPRRLE
jgi:hypothetical protein